MIEVPPLAEWQKEKMMQELGDRRYQGYLGYHEAIGKDAFGRHQLVIPKPDNGYVECPFCGNVMRDWASRCEHYRRQISGMGYGYCYSAVFSRD